MEYKILILGSDINAYTMARAYYELTGNKADLISRLKLKVTSDSKICKVRYEKNLLEPNIFKDTLLSYALENRGKKIILVGTNDYYVKAIAEHVKFLSKYYLFNYPSLEIISDFLNKENFYIKYHSYFEMPKTIVYSCSEKKLNKKELLYPVVVKPVNTYEYFKLSFIGQAKVFKVDNQSELTSVLKLIEEAGYKDKLLIQEFIPGDDSKLFDCMFYVNSKGKAEHATFAQIGLQEHTKTGVGNCTVLVNGFSEFGCASKIINTSKKFLEDLKYCGFAEFDFKYDIRDNKYKLLEINPRQARCSYYFSICAKNLMKCLIDDLIYKKHSDFEFSQKKLVLSFVPKNIIHKNIDNHLLLKEINKTIKSNGLINPLKYDKDLRFSRIIYLFLRDLNYKKKYKNPNWWK